MNCCFCGEDEREKLIELLINNNNTSNKLVICHECLFEVFNQTLYCNNCNAPIDAHSQHIDAQIKNGKLICPNCLCDNMCVFSFKSNNLNSYGYKPNPKFYKEDNDNDQLFMGVELEIGGLNSYNTVNSFCNHHSANFFYYKNDGSISGAGCEIVTHPATLKYHESNKSGWRLLFKHFNDLHFISGSSTNTGLHIHVNRNILSNTQMKKMDLLVNGNEFVKKIARRSGNSYCVYQNKRHNNWGMSGSRYESVNFNNRHTVEFRIFNGTNKVEELFGSLEFVKSIINISNNISYEELYEDKELIFNKLKEYASANNLNYLLELIDKEVA